MYEVPPSNNKPPTGQHLRRPATHHWGNVIWVLGGAFLLYRGVTAETTFTVLFDLLLGVSAITSGLAELLPASQHRSTVRLRVLGIFGFPLALVVGMVQLFT